MRCQRQCLCSRKKIFSAPIRATKSRLVGGLAAQRCRPSAGVARGTVAPLRGPWPSQPPPSATACCRAHLRPRRTAARCDRQRSRGRRRGARRWPGKARGAGIRRGRCASVAQLARRRRTRVGRLAQRRDPQIFGLRHAHLDGAPAEILAALQHLKSAFKRAAISRLQQILQVGNVALALACAFRCFSASHPLGEGIGDGLFKDVAPSLGPNQIAPKLAGCVDSFSERIRWKHAHQRCQQAVQVAARSAAAIGATIPKMPQERLMQITSARCCCGACTKARGASSCGGMDPGLRSGIV